MSERLKDQWPQSQSLEGALEYQRREPKMKMRRMVKKSFEQRMINLLREAGVPKSAEERAEFFGSMTFNEMRILDELLELELKKRGILH